MLRNFSREVEITAKAAVTSFAEEIPPNMAFLLSAVLTQEQRKENAESEAWPGLQFPMSRHRNVEAHSTRNRQDDASQSGASLGANFCLRLSETRNTITLYLPSFLLLVAAFFQRNLRGAGWVLVQVHLHPVLDNIFLKIS